MPSYLSLCWRQQQSKQTQAWPSGAHGSDGETNIRQVILCTKWRYKLRDVKPYQQKEQDRTTTLRINVHVTWTREGQSTASREKEKSLGEVQLRELMGVFKGPTGRPEYQEQRSQAVYEDTQDRG